MKEETRIFAKITGMLNWLMKAVRKKSVCIQTVNPLETLKCFEMIAVV